MKGDGVAFIIKNRKGKFLLQKRDQGAPKAKNYWTLFGGGVEHEEPIYAAARELDEELGIRYETSQLKFLGIKKQEDELAGENNVHYFGLKLNNISDISLTEGCGYAFFSLEEITKMKDFIWPRSFEDIEDFGKKYK